MFARMFAQNDAPIRHALAVMLSLFASGQFTRYRWCSGIDGCSCDAAG